MSKKTKKTINNKTINNKTINRKTKLKNKNVVSVKINIDNSRKTTARRTTASKPSNMQPFVNFPSHQPTRIQLLEPKQQFSSPDLSKTMDEYQKQFKTYLETTDKSVKDMIEKYDDTLKKNIAPQKKEEESKPMASNVYADTQGENVFEEPIVARKTQMNKREPFEFKPQNISYAKDDSNLNIGFAGWGKNNQFQGNNLTSTKAKPSQLNNLVATAEKKTEPVSTQTEANFNIPQSKLTDTEYTFNLPPKSKPKPILTDTENTFFLPPKSKPKLTDTENTFNLPPKSKPKPILTDTQSIFNLSPQYEEDYYEQGFDDPLLNDLTNPNLYIESTNSFLNALKNQSNPTSEIMNKNEGTMTVYVPPKKKEDIPKREEDKRYTVYPGIKLQNKIYDENKLNREYDKNLVEEMRKKRIMIYQQPKTIVEPYIKPITEKEEQLWMIFNNMATKYSSRRGRKGKGLLRREMNKVLESLEDLEDAKDNEDNIKKIRKSSSTTLINNYETYATQNLSNLNLQPINKVVKVTKTKSDKSWINKK
jgi:hypothetical protein